MDPAIDGVRMVPLAPHDDARGAVVELFRVGWDSGVTPVQWTLTRSRATTLRGVHCHLEHADFVVVLAGEMLLGLHDLRPDTESTGVSTTVQLEELQFGVVIPAGVAHGFYFPVHSVCLIGASREWDPGDELRCRFDDHDLGISWPTDSPLLSAADEAAGSVSDVRDAVRAAFRSRVT